MSERDKAAGALGFYVKIKGTAANYVGIALQDFYRTAKAHD